MDNCQLTAKTISLRLVEEDDAGFIHALRTNDIYNQHLSSTTGDVSSQKKWISKYKERERNKEEFYFIIERIDNGQKIGTVRLYDFITANNSFCWGSWILNENKTTSSAVESALLVYKFAFEELGFSQSHFDVRKDNIKVIAFHEKLGAIRDTESELDIFYNFPKSRYEESLDKFNKYLVR